MTVGCALHRVLSIPRHPIKHPGLFPTVSVCGTGREEQGIAGNPSLGPFPPSLKAPKSSGRS